MHFLHSMDGEPTSLDFRSQMARIYLYLGQHKKGIEVISPLSLSQAGVFGMLLYAETGQMAKAIEIARGDPSRTPYGFQAYMSGYVLVAAGDQTGAREMWDKGVRYGEVLLARNENPMTRVLHGMIYAKLGRREQALRNMEQSLATDPQHPRLLFFCGPNPRPAGPQARSAGHLESRHRERIIQPSDDRVSHAARYVLLHPPG
jgi:tetratricopeptide (TPR) repeat protein